MWRLSCILLLITLTLVTASHQQHPRHNQHAKARRNFELERRRDNTTMELEKRDSFSGRGTFFYVGLGACGQYSQDSDLMVALNTPQYGGGYPGPECFKYITVQANGVTVSGVEILDECPTCDWGGLDMSPGLFQRFADEGVGVLSITWWFEDGSGGGGTATSTKPKPTPTSTWVAPTSTWVAPSTTTAWTPTTTSTSAWTPSTSTWVAPTSTSTSTWVAPSSSSTSTSAYAASASSSSMSSAIVSSSAHINSTSLNPFAVVSSYSPTVSAAAPSASASAGVSDTTGDTPADVGTTANVQGNLILINGLVTNYGQIVVVAAGGYL